MLLSKAEKREEYSGVNPSLAITVLFLSSLGIGVFFFAFPLFAFRSNWPGGWLGLVFSLYYLARLLVAPIAGELADRYGARVLLLTATYLACLLVASYFIFPHQYSLFYIQFGLGISSGIIKPVALTLLASQAPSGRQGKAFGWSNTATNLVFFLGPALGGLLFYSFQMERILGFVLGCMFLSSLLVHFLYPRDGLVSLQTAKERQAKRNTSRPGGQMALMAAVFGRTLGISALLVFFPILLTQKLAGPAWSTGLLVAVPGGISCLLLPFTGKLADSSQRSVLVLIGMLVSAAALVILGSCSNLAAFISIGIIMGLGTALSLPSSMVQAIEGTLAKGRMLGIFQTTASAGFLIGPIFSGVLVQWTASAETGLIAAGLVGLLSCLPLIIGSLSGSQRSVFLITGAVLILGSLATIDQHSSALQQNERSFNSPVQRQTYANLAMGGIVHLKTEGTDEKTAQEAATAAFTVIAELENDFGHRSPRGSVGRINSSAGREKVTVSAAAFHLIERALHFGKLSDGVFDITIGAVTSLPFYYQQMASKDKAALVDYRKVEMDTPTQSVFLPQEGMALDLGGLAKGSIVDAAAAELQKAGIPSALIEASGDFYCYGERIWRIGIQDPRSDGLLGVIEVQNAGVCGSGDYYQYVDSDNEERSHHILDAGRLTSAHQSIAVTAIAPSTELADALATTLFIMGPEKGQTFLRQFKDCSAMWVLPDKTIVTSPSFPAFVEH
ncbi:MAG: hypothetical protein CSA20_07940 [Deltaproteobacteria bacterium]|nr:MAG: hypothetical protein CSA20_07940 [Deltaproteobacteria bacterium]